MSPGMVYAFEFATEHSIPVEIRRILNSVE